MARSPQATQARQTQAQGQVVPFTGPSQLASTWPDTGDAGDLRSIVQDQALTIAEQAIMLDRYQDVLNTAQATPQGVVATATGTSTGTSSLVVTGTSGTIEMNAVVSGGGIPAGITVVGQTAGTAGGDGTYTLSDVTTVTSIPVAFTPPASTMPWPTPTDAPTLMLVLQSQTALLRTQAAAIQHYQEVLNNSQTPAA